MLLRCQRIASDSLQTASLLPVSCGDGSTWQLRIRRKLSRCSDVDLRPTPCTSKRLLSPNGLCQPASGLKETRSYDGSPQDVGEAKPTL